MPPSRAPGSRATQRAPLHCPEGAKDFGPGPEDASSTSSIAALGTSANPTLGRPTRAASAIASPRPKPHPATNRILNHDNTGRESGTSVFSHTGTTSARGQMHVFAKLRFQNRLSHYIPTDCPSALRPRLSAIKWPKIGAFQQRRPRLCTISFNFDRIDVRARRLVCNYRNAYAASAVPTAANVIAINKVRRLKRNCSRFAFVIGGVP